MSYRKKEKSFSLVHLWWFLAIVTIVVAGAVYISVSNTDKIVARAQQNQEYTTQLFKLLRAEPEWKVSTDSLGRNYIDSIKVVKPAQAQLLEKLLIEQSTRQLTEYSDTLTREAASLNNTLVVWAGVLTLMAVIFTFLGFMELRERLASVDRKSSEIDNTLEKATETIDNKVEEVHDALEEISDKRNELERIQYTLDSLAQKLNVVAVNSLSAISQKEKDITTLWSEVKINTQTSAYNLYLQLALSRVSSYDKIAEMSNLLQSVGDNKDIPADKKAEILGEIYFYIGLVRYDLGELKNALDAYSKSLEIFPDAVTYNNRGQIYIQQGKMTKAVSDFDKAIVLKPESLYYANRANAKRLQGNIPAAIDDYGIAIGIAPLDPNLYMSRGMVYTNLNEVDRALSDFGHAIDLDPDNDVYYSKRGNLYYYLEKNNQALTDYLKAIKINAENPDYYCDRGDVYAQMSEINKALSDYSKAIEINPHNARFYNNRAILYAQTDNLNTALSDYSTAIGLDPVSAEYFTNRGTAYLQQQEADKAIADFDNAIELDALFIRAIYQRGLTYVFKNEDEKALSDFEKCVAMDSDNKLGYKKKASVRIEALGNRGYIFLLLRIESVSNAYGKSLIARFQVFSARHVPESMLSCQFYNNCLMFYAYPAL